MQRAKLQTPLTIATRKGLPTSSLRLGFTLLELAVVLLVSTVLGLALWKFLPSMRGSANGDAHRTMLLAAQAALDGFVLRENRLPCPASSASGLEDCATNLQAGALPFATLGLATSVDFLTGAQLRYGVYRNAAATGAQDADLASATLRFSPLTPLPITGAITGLDFCVGLKNAIANPNPLAAVAGGIPLAYGLAHPGMNGGFELSHIGAVPRFEESARGQSESYDDVVLATGLSELFGRLSCPQRLGAANGAASSLYAAFDNNATAELYEEYRTFVVRVRMNNLAFAISSAALASADLLIALAGSATSVALTAATVGIGAFTIPVALVAVGLSIAAEVAALASVVVAGLALDKAQTQRNAAIAYKRDVTEPTLQEALNAAKIIVKRGLLP